MTSETEILIGKGASPQSLLLSRANRHGLISGATGTGKTVTLQVLAEGFSEQGVPVFVSDVKGDLSGISQAATLNEKLTARAESVGVAGYAASACPTVFWDLFGESGHPLRATISEMGPLLLSRLLNLNDTQEGVLSIAFQVADDEGLLLLDLKDLRALLTFVADSAAELTASYGTVSKRSVGAIQRRLLTLEQEGAEDFFGEPALDLHDFLRTDRTGRGMVNVLAADRLINHPKLYATFLLWLLSELFEELPEIGDPDKPKLVFFFDEAHLLFDDAPKVLVDKVEQVVRLIRSKGVGVFFVTQSPLDIPDDVLGQLGNRVQHALRAFTPRDQKAVRTVAQTFRQNPAFDAAEAITQLEVGEALVSTLDVKGAPGLVDRTRVRPPASRIGPASASERDGVMADSPFAGRYDREIDRDSAYELLQKRAETAAAQQPDPPQPKTRQRQSSTEVLVKSVLRSVGRTLGREIIRGVLGSIFKGR